MSSILDDIAGAYGQLSSLSGYLPSAAYDVVGVYDQDFNQLFRNARPMRAMVREPAKIMEHPLESGASTTDHIVFLPVEINLTLILKPNEYRNTFEQIRQAFRAAKVLTVQTLVGAYDNMLMGEMPHDETPDMYGTVSVSIQLRQVQFVTAQYQQMSQSTVKSGSNSSTVKKGEAQTSTATAAQDGAARGASESYLHGIFN